MPRIDYSEIATVLSESFHVTICSFFGSLCDYIQWHLDNKDHDAIPGLEELPPEVQLKHVINAWRTSVELCDDYHDKRDAASA